jgi:hypothetical protein
MWLSYAKCTSNVNLLAHYLRTLKHQHPSSRCGLAIFLLGMVQVVPSSVRFVTRGDFWKDQCLACSLAVMSSESHGERVLVFV